MTGLRPLLMFWACVLGVALGVGVALQALGPLPAKPNTAGHPVPPGQASVPAAPAPPPQPARIAPSAANPAPPLAMRLAAIPDPDPALLEPSPDLPDRMVPKVDASGRSASVLYAAAFDPAERHPRVALVIAGAGLDRSLTEQAIRTLPAGVDLAFSAYAPARVAEGLASASRALGRECLVSIPMEPNGFPVVEEGKFALLTGGRPATLRQNLAWALSNVAGCVGATGASDGMAGERFASSRQAFADMLNEVETRGLLYLDPRPDAPLPEDWSNGHPLPYVADLAVDRASAPDRPADAQTIDARLAQLTTLAAKHGSAIGIAGPPTPVLLERVAVWAQGLAANGVVLAPLSAIPPPRAADAAAR
jgi:polysaccharide deacetylase 2 family uncharacterized protein YibQ